MYIQKILGNKISSLLMKNNVKFKDNSQKFEYFCNKMVLKKYDYYEEDLILGSVAGGDDAGIDSIFILINGKLVSDVELIEELIDRNSVIEFIIIQSKREKGFSETALLRLKDGLKIIFEGEEEFTNKAFQRQANLLQKAWDIKVRIGTERDITTECYYCTIAQNNDIAFQNDKVQRISKAIEDLLKGNGFKAKINFCGCRELLKISSLLPEYRKPIKILDSFKYDEEDNITGYICSVKGVDYLDFIVDNNVINDDIFEQNVRDYLGEHMRVNRNIINTLGSSVSKKFWCLNNGITIIASKIEMRKGELYLSNYQIINGCQTSYSIYEAFKNMPREKIEEVKFEIILKIIEISEENEELTLKIIEATNSQTMIESYAFESHKHIHKMIEEMFLNKKPNTKFYYERRPKYYRRRDKPVNKILNPKKLFQVCYSIYNKRPGLARSAPTRIFNEEKDLIFKENYNLEYYWIAYSLYNLVITEIAYVKKDDIYTESQKELLRLAQFHLTRIIFSLMIGKDPNLIPYFTKQNIKNIIGEIVYKMFDKNEIKVPVFLNKALKILEESIKELGLDKSYDYVLKTDELDKKITKKLAKFLSMNK